MFSFLVFSGHDIRFHFEILGDGIPTPILVCVEVVTNVHKDTLSPSMDRAVRLETKGAVNFVLELISIEVPYLLGNIAARGQ